MTRTVWRLGAALAVAAMAVTLTAALAPPGARRGARPAGREVVPGPVSPHRHQPLPGPGADQRQGAVQLPGRLGRAGAVRRHRDGQEDRAEAGRRGDLLDAHRSARYRGRLAARGRQGAGRGPVPARRHERPGPARRLDRRHPGVHDPGPLPAGDRPDRGPDDLDAAGLRPARTARAADPRAGEKAEAPAGREGDERAGPAGQGHGLPHGQAAGGAVAPPRLPGPGVGGPGAGRAGRLRAARPPRARRLARREGRPQGRRPGPPDQRPGRRGPQGGPGRAWPTSGRATPSPCSSAAARGPTPASRPSPSTPGRACEPWTDHHHPVCRERETPRSRRASGGVLVLLAALATCAAVVRSAVIGPARAGLEAGQSPGGRWSAEGSGQGQEVGRPVRDAADQPHAGRGEDQRQGAVPADLRPRCADHAAEQPGERGLGRGQGRRPPRVPVRDAGRGRDRQARGRRADGRPSCR